MISRRIILTIVFLSIVLLLIECFLSFDFAASKNNAFTHMPKDEIEKMANIDSVKIKAKESLDIIRRIHRDNANQASWRFLLLIFILIGIILLTFNKKRNVTN
jgi:hypothetical protein